MHEMQEGFGRFDNVGMEEDLVHYGFDFGMVQELFELVNPEADYQRFGDCTEEDRPTWIPRST